MFNIVPTLPGELLISPYYADLLDLNSGHLAKVKSDSHRCVLQHYHGRTDLVLCTRG